jgi:hypothetical protein
VRTWNSACFLVKSGKLVHHWHCQLLSLILRVIALVSTKLACFRNLLSGAVFSELCANIPFLRQAILRQSFSELLHLKNRSPCFFVLICANEAGMGMAWLGCVAVVVVGLAMLSGILKAVVGMAWLGCVAVVVVGLVMLSGSLPASNVLSTHGYLVGFSSTGGNRVSPSCGHGAAIDEVRATGRLLLLAVGVLLWFVGVFSAAV